MGHCEVLCVCGAEADRLYNATSRCFSSLVSTSAAIRSAKERVSFCCGVPRTGNTGQSVQPKHASCCGSTASVPSDGL